MLKDVYPFYLGSKPIEKNQDLEVFDKYTGDVAFKVALADSGDVDAAISAACDASGPMAAMAPYERQEVLNHCVRRFQERFDEFSESLCVEAGKPIRDAEGEVTRLIDTFRIAAEEAVRIEGVVHNLEISPRAKGYTGMSRRVPVGPCSFISPFNFPLNLVAHKVAPAIAAGCPFILKPASRTPVGALLIAEVLAETNLPPGAFSVLPSTRDGAKLFTTDDRLKLLSFTGSPDVGWDLKSKAGKKKVVLELGGNAACVLTEDWTEISFAIDRIIFGAYYQSGQSCVSVQRVIVHKSIYNSFKNEFVKKVKELKSGNPKDRETFIGPMITEAEAKRVESWVEEAVSDGGKLLCGGKRDGAMFEATVLEGIKRTSKLYCGEVFGPVVMLSTYSDFEDALEEVNDSEFGLQAGIFTQDLFKTQKAWNTLDVGGVIIGDVPSWRVDNMPYGGVKNSGIGREGVKYAIDDMLENRLLVIKER